MNNGDCCEECTFMGKIYKGIFFDWDGTAVLSRKAPVDEAIAVMKPLLQKGVDLVIVSGTTIENIAGGKIESYFTSEELNHLYLGLGRGAYNYFFDNGQPMVFENRIPEKEELLKIHEICFEIHRRLKEFYDYDTDIVFSRPNYCKIDLMVDSQRGDNLFMQENEVGLLKECLKQHGIPDGLQGLLNLSKEVGKEYGIQVQPTCDAKYLEVGITSKSDNVDCILEKLITERQINIEECSFWGDEFVGIEKGIYGSDSFMITAKSKQGDFFDVSQVPGERPEGVECLGGGVNKFLEFLRDQNK